MKILIVGQSPSKKNIDPKIPFVGTQSLNNLNAWTDFLEIAEYNIINSNDTVEAKNADLDHLKNNIVGFDKIIALGKIANSALNKLKVDHITLPHPSPKNLKLNDKKYLKEALLEAKRKLYESNN